MLNLFASRTHKVRLNIFSVPSIFLFHLVYMLLNHTWPGIINFFYFVENAQFVADVMRKYDYLNGPTLFDQ